MTLHILVDSSTKGTAKTDKYGESVAAWAAWWKGSMKRKPCRCGIHYFYREGPNKTFYQGVIRALEQCLSLCWGDQVIVWGDCEPVLKQLKGEWAVSVMKLEYDQVQGLVRKYQKKNNTVSILYLNEKHPHYKKIDQLAKRSHSFFYNLFR